MIKTAVIGASGYIGSHLIKKYRQFFPDCVGTGFSRCQELIPFDLRHPDLKTLRLEDSNYQAVLIASAAPNIAWCEANPKESYDLNVKGTLELVRQIAKTSLKTLFLSSDYVFNGKEGQYTDQAETNPNTEYGRQKAEVECEIPKITQNYSIFRLSKIYGTVKKDGTLLDLMVTALMQNQKQMLATDQFFSPTYIDDVVAMILYAEEQGASGLFNLCNPNRYSRYQIAQLLSEELSVSPSLLQPVSLHHITGMENRPLDTSLVCSEIFVENQLSFYTMEDAIKKVSSNWQK